MDQDRFDSFVAALGATRPRRAILAALGGVALALGASLAATARPKKKPKKCPKARKCGKTCCKKGTQCLAGVCGVPCTFTTDSVTMSLDRSCVLTEDVSIPPGVILDGNNRTITLGGQRASPPALLITQGAGGIQHLTINAGRLKGDCGDGRDLIQIANSSGALTGVSVRGMRCDSAISAVTGSTDNILTIVDTTIEGSGAVAIRLRGDLGGRIGRLYVSILDSEIRGSKTAAFGTGIAAIARVDLLVKHATIAGASTGIFTNSDVPLTVEDTTITGAEVGISTTDVFSSLTPTALVTARRNTIIGPGMPSTAGLLLRDTLVVDLRDNMISNYFSRPSDIPACGIDIGPGVSSFTNINNTFPPPGNDQNLCL